MSDERDFQHTDFLAHIRNDNGCLIAHRLEDHLLDVSALAADFAAEFGAAPWAALAGIWHDLGKYREGFQRYIRQCGDPDAHIEGRVAGPEKTHSAAGALWAQQYLAEVDKRSGPVVARVLAYLIAGHHAGLDNWFGGLHERLSREDTQREGRDALAVEIPEAILKPSAGLPDLKAIRTDQKDNIPGRFALWVRMLFSCLVDADFLDTERFMSQGKAEARSGFMPVDELEKRLAERLALMAQEVAARGEAGSQVNLKRAEVLRACLAKAECPPGVFSLTVPTGGGKTLSSLAFALRHAVRHGKRRVVYAIPYTSIIEQTAGIFRSIFGDENVIEHHSNVEVDDTQETARSRLACENWDAPLIVTTNVQLLESLFASRTSRCRKLHNLVGSVIVLDEAQLLPVPYLQPVVDVLRLLVKDYGATLVLCTATQPTLESRNGFDQARQLRGFAAGEISEIVDDVAGLYGALERVRVHLPADLKTPCNWEQLAPQIAGHDAVLAVVGRRADARELYTRVKAEDRTGLWHLSGLMCAQHRSDTIADIKQALLTRRQAMATGQDPAPIRVISTQLVEAGVDIDFPVVYRALAGADAIAQAAGRCNREGRLPQPGQVHVFVPPTASPPGLLRLARDTCKAVWHDLPADPLAIEHVRRYFERMLHDAPSTDARRICELLHCRADLHELIVPLALRSAAEAFRLIDDEDTATVLVRYRSPHGGPDIDALIGLLQREGPTRWLMRRLQRFGVSIYRRDAETLLGRGDIEEIGTCPGLYVQREHWHDLYDPVLGLRVAAAPGDPLLA